MASDCFVDNGDGTVTDTKTGLMWAVKDNGGLINWSIAHSYCQSYNGGGHTDWRVPTQGELQSLYDPDIQNKNDYHVHKLIETTAESSWAMETRCYGAARLNYTFGQESWLRQSYLGPGKTLTVRSSK